MKRKDCLDKIDSLMNCYLKLAEDSDYAYHKTMSLEDVSGPVHLEVFEKIKTSALENSIPEVDMLIEKVIQIIKDLLDTEQFTLSIGFNDELKYIFDNVRIWIDKNGIILIGIELRPRNRIEKEVPVVVEPFVCILPGDEYYDEFIEKLSKPFDKYFNNGSKLILKNK